jgi:hypothetical protein
MEGEGSMMTIALGLLAVGTLAAVLFWPDTEGWHPLARDDRREGYADGMGGKRAQVGRTAVYHRAFDDGVWDCMSLRLDALEREGES